MALMIEMRVMELLAARLCHDLAGPIAAIANGAELLDDDDPDFVKQAATLIGDSAGTASRRLQLFRFVFGFSSGAMAGPAPHVLAGEYFAGGNIACIYTEEARQLEPVWQRLGCNLLIIAGEALPRGGSLTLSAPDRKVTVAVTGESPGLPAEVGEALTLRSSVEALTSRAIVAYLAGLLAQTLGCRLRVAGEPSGLRIVCEAA